MKILFIGGTGNISADCAALLRARGHDICVMTRGRGAVPPDYHALVADRKDLEAVRASLSGLKPDVVLNFLGYELSDVQADHALFRGRTGQYVFISSTTVYARPPHRLPFREDSPLGNPYWDYAQKKLECERWLLGRWEEERFPVTIVRPSHTYSRYWIPNPLSSSSYTFAARLEQGQPVYVPDQGETPWTLTASSDFAIGLAGLLENQAALGHSFHITSDEVLTWNQIVGEIARALGVSSPAVVPVATELICRIAPQMTGTLKGDKAHPGIFDNAKIKNFVPGFTCRKVFRDGVKESVAWLRAHPDQQNLKPELNLLCEQVIAAARAER
ncbi:MAG: NAD-dependent epimerase/dehydratase family protein [Verrucomicrobiota bacterium]